jgi:hypothetical protein
MHEFLNFRSQLHDVIRARSDRKKKEEAVRFNREIMHYQFLFDDFIILYQKKSNKLKSRWRESFRISEYDENHDISYIIKQLNKRKIKKTFHENHFKLFSFKTDYLVDSFDISLQSEQIIRKSQKFKKTKAN